MSRRPDEPGFEPHSRPRVTPYWGGVSGNAGRWFIALFSFQRKRSLKEENCPRERAGFARGLSSVG